MSTITAPISNMLLKVYMMVGRHKLDNMVGLYPRGKRFSIMTAEEYGMTQKEFSTAVIKQDKRLGVDRHIFEYCTPRPSMPVALGRLLEDAIEGVIYVKSIYKQLIYSCPISGNTLPILKRDYRGMGNLDSIINKLFVEYYGKVDIDAHDAIARFVDSLPIERDYTYSINVDGDYLTMSKGNSFKEERYDYMLHQRRAESVSIHNADMDEIKGVFDGTKII